MAYYIAEGKAVTSRRGIIGADHENPELVWQDLCRTEKEGRAALKSLADRGILTNKPPEKKVVEAPPPPPPPPVTPPVIPPVTPPPPGAELTPPTVTPPPGAELTPPATGAEGGAVKANTSDDS